MVVLTTWLKFAPRPGVWLRYFHYPVRFVGNVRGNQIAAGGIQCDLSGYIQCPSCQYSLVIGADRGRGSAGLNDLLHVYFIGHKYIFYQPPILQKAGMTIAVWGNESAFEELNTGQPGIEWLRPETWDAFLDSGAQVLFNLEEPKTGRIMPKSLRPCSSIV